MPVLSFDLQILDEVDSTNNHIKRAIKHGAKEGTAVLAYTQTGGYGRRGHSWKSPEGGMYLSALLRPAEHLDFSGGLPPHLPTLSLVISLAVRDALHRILDHAEASEGKGGFIKVKWPNDVMVVSQNDGDESIAKLCGISLEVIEGALCVGIGVNVRAPHDAYQLENARRASDGRQYALAFLDDISSFDEPISVERVAKAVLDSLMSYYTRWISHGFAPFVSEYDAADLLTGKEVIIDSDGEQALCSIEGVDVSGNLIARNVSDGNLVEVSFERSHIRFYERS